MSRLQAVCVCVVPEASLINDPPKERMLIRIVALSLALGIATGCTKLPTLQSISNLTQPTTPQTSKLNAASKLDAPTASKIQRYATDRQNQVAIWGYSDGHEDGVGNSGTSFPSNPAIGITSHALTDPAEQKIYTDAYSTGYAQGKVDQPSPSPPSSPSPSSSPLPTGTVTPARQAELQKHGDEDGTLDARSNFAANPGGGIVTWNLTDPTERQIYTTAYNTAYQRQLASSTSPPTLAPGRLTALQTQGYNEGYYDAQQNISPDTVRRVSLLGVITTAEQNAYIKGYNSGYQTYVKSQAPVPGPLW